MQEPYCSTHELLLTALKAKHDALTRQLAQLQAAERAFSRSKVVVNDSAEGEPAPVAGDASTEEVEPRAVAEEALAALATPAVPAADAALIVEDL